MFLVQTLHVVCTHVDSISILEKHRTRQACICINVYMREHFNGFFTYGMHLVYLTNRDYYSSTANRTKTYMWAVEEER